MRGRCTRRWRRVTGAVLELLPEAAEYRYEELREVCVAARRERRPGSQGP